MTRIYAYFFAFILTICILNVTNAQDTIPSTLDVDTETTLRPNGISGKVVFMDYHSPNGGRFGDTENITTGFEVGFIRHISKLVNLSVPLKAGVINLPGELNNRTIIGLDAVLHFKYFKEKNALTPYLLAGIGTILEDFEQNNFQVPIGIGTNIRLGSFSYLNLQAEYRIGFDDNRSNLIYGLGLNYFLGKPGDVDPAVTITPTDRDGDGVVDEKDDCPELAGLVALGGCPDRDNDGVSDAKDKCPDQAGDLANEGCPAVDSDGDGFADKIDKCPKVAGKLYGCPDSDGDSVIDKEDDCPNEKGLISNNGCPTNSNDSDGDGFADNIDDCPNLKGNVKGCPDSDGDGVADKNDDCPNVSGVAKFNGCPDQDGDGVADKNDNCPSSYGPASNGGCPILKAEEKRVLDYAMQAVQFETGSDNLKQESYAVLDQIASIMLSEGSRSLSIVGHTDNVGTESNNQSLSVRRAKACYNYLKTKDVSPLRMSYGGFGETRPIADNDSIEGRSLNRRVEFTVDLK